MSSKIPFFNWSIKKLLKDETDVLLKSKYKIVFIFFVLFFIKGSVALVTAVYFEQGFQTLRAALFLFVCLLLFKSMLNKTIPLNAIIHILIICIFAVICTNIFVTAKSINIITLQFVFTLILSSFYILNSRFGIIYSILAVAPVILSLSIGYQFNTGSGLNTLASPGYEIMIFTNFLTIIYIPYIFQKAFVDTLKEKEALNLKLQTAVQVANDAVKSKSEFLSTMSHELRTPLNTVIGTTDLLLADTYQPHQVDNLKDLKFSAGCLLNIINDVLDYNKLEFSKLKLESVNVDLMKLVNMVCSSLQSQAIDKNTHLTLDIDNDLANYEVFTDATRISQILYNLVGNAVKFTSVGDVILKLNILKKDKENLSIRFSVKDSGIGISEEQQALIFEPFNQASTSITRNYGGTGLGLSIVKRLLVLFGSTIQLESKLHQGSEFYFDLNLKYQIVSRNKPIEKVEYEKPLQELSDLNILIAEDNLMNRVLIQKVFSRWGNIPVFAENGKEAVEMADTKKFDLILMDLHMPVMDGYLASKTIKENISSINHQTPIIAFTASVSDTILAEVKTCGMVDFIYKPFDVTEMYNKIRNVCPLNH